MNWNMHWTMRADARALLIKTYQFHLFKIFSGGSRDKNQAILQWCIPVCFDGGFCGHYIKFFIDWRKQSHATVLLLDLPDQHPYPLSPVFWLSVRSSSSLLVPLPYYYILVFLVQNQTVPQKNQRESLYIIY